MIVCAVWLDAGVIHLATFAGQGTWEPLCNNLGPLGYEQETWPHFREQTRPGRGGGRLVRRSWLDDGDWPDNERPDGKVCEACTRRWQTANDAIEALLRR